MKASVWFVLALFLALVVSAGGTLVYRFLGLWPALVTTVVLATAAGLAARRPSSRS